MTSREESILSVIRGTTWSVQNGMKAEPTMPGLVAHATTDAAARAAEREFLGLEMGDGQRAGILPVAERVRTPDGRLYGGAMLGVAITAMESATERRIVWATTQFVASAPHGARIEVVVEELARGGRSSQVLVRGSTSDGPMFTALGATGVEQAGRASTATYVAMPDVPPPDDCPPLLAARAGRRARLQAHHRHPRRRRRSRPRARPSC